jgi:hypothetical protein
MHYYKLSVIPSHNFEDFTNEERSPMCFHQFEVLRFEMDEWCIRIWKESAITCLNILSWHSPRYKYNNENHGNYKLLCRILVIILIKFKIIRHSRSGICFPLQAEKWKGSLITGPSDSDKLSLRVQIE